VTTVITRTTARVVVPIILVVSVSLFLQGHNLPGGGFIGGVLTVTAFALLYIAYGLDYLEEDVLGREVEARGSPFEDRIVAAYRRTFALGLVVAVVGGLAPVLFRLPVLSQTFVVLEGVPLYHHLELASALVFDLGVYLVVVGGLLTILSVVGAE
jgi:multicomponent Na+:H+ antiporter subunit B